eukprot:CAMPEP_0173390336 /NCGR_PEP_ID=MMETSP1356-20130122/14519_1 /TAXON_ID=77927 ORGANISM="Hemiselmis virescens, Strain PCC157" /NCGR_SAMPLE_ID=MMETSP1356 /ASSEMBLY_ACC=CAM_ASM_000847 /LENGTH=309 /DNA_ID=CAMNT_0014347691 /DNA_START=198 /DNA_END=1123 /DNA_ORIENTATION=+
MRCLLVALMGLLAVASAGRIPDDPNKVLLGLDCGSSGSRVCVYYYDKDPHDLVMAETGCVSVKPGLSSFADDPSKAGDSLKILFDHAKSMNLPEGSKVYLAATAGLRALPDKKAVDKIMADVKSYMKDNYSPQFVWAAGYPRVLSGNEEGVFGWMAVNHMLGTLGGSFANTVGSLDMGGSSTQITFVAQDPASVPNGYKFSMPYKGKVYHLYTHSFAGYGYNSARASLLEDSNTVGNTGVSQVTTLIDPCAFAGYTGDARVNDEEVSVSGTGSWGDCTTRCKLLLSRGWPCVGVGGGTGVVTSTGGPST